MSKKTSDNLYFWSYISILHTISFQKMYVLYVVQFITVILSAMAWCSYFPRQFQHFNSFKKMIKNSLLIETSVLKTGTLDSSYHKLIKIYIWFKYENIPTPVVLNYIWQITPDPPFLDHFGKLNYPPIILAKNKNFS